MREDPFDLDRFVRAQADDIGRALEELRGGRKRSHWMWFVFPQFEGLGSSPMAQRYAIRSLSEAQAYLDHPTLAFNLKQAATALLAVQGKSATDILGSPDDLKLRSSATLFASVSPAGSVFHRLLEKYYGGRPDPETLRLIGRSGPL